MLSSIDESLFNLQDALLGAVHPCLRAVQIDLDEKQKKVSYYFYYDCDVTDELFELASVAVTEAWSPDYYVEQHILQLPVTEMIPIHGRFAFLRKESNLPSFNNKINKDLVKNETPIVALLLDIQKALLGKVTSALRIVTIDVNTDEKELNFYFEYDCPISEEDRNLANCTAKEASASFPEYSIHCNVFPVGANNPMGKRSAYARWESNY